MLVVEVRVAGGRLRATVPKQAPDHWQRLLVHRRMACERMLLKRAASKELVGWGRADQTLPDL